MLLSCAWPRPQDGYGGDSNDVTRAPVTQGPGCLLQAQGCWIKRRHLCTSLIPGKDRSLWGNHSPCESVLFRGSPLIWPTRRASCGQPLRRVALTVQRKARGPQRPSLVGGAVLPRMGTVWVHRVSRRSRGKVRTELPQPSMLPASSCCDPVLLWPFGGTSQASICSLK